MVNYCCVTGCGRNSRSHGHLKFYGLPKDKTRQKLWLKAAGKDNILDKDLEKLRRSIRFCSRHFLPSCLKNKYLNDNAMPTKSLPGTLSDDENEPGGHEGIICDVCSGAITGFRYKCVTCDNFDLCSGCEMYQSHPQHYMLRIPKSIKFKVADNLIKQWRSFFKSEHITPETNSNNTLDSDSSDDEPVTKYVRNYDSGLELSEDVKKCLREEVERALTSLKKKKREGESIDEVPRKQSKSNVEEPKVPELAFADVSEYDTCDVKSEAPSAENTAAAAADEQPLYFLRMSDDLSQLMIENRSFTYDG